MVLFQHSRFIHKSCAVPCIQKLNSIEPGLTLFMDWSDGATTEFRPSVGVEISRVNPRFHPTDVG